MRLSCVELAPFIGAYDLNGVNHRSWLVEALAEGVPNQRSRRYVVAASPQVYFLKQLPPILEENAALQDSQGAAFV
jgi:hypothetical protein